jgi:hypothetical protein
MRQRFVGFIDKAPPLLIIDGCLSTMTIKTGNGFPSFYAGR